MAKEIETKLIYYAKDRGFPLNELYQKIVDDWLNGDKLAEQLMEYEITMLKRVMRELQK